LIGNDIIDRQIPISKNWNTPRYLNKIYTSLEQQHISASVDPELMVQILWSLKEAAYKAHQRRFNLKRSYNPIQFNCQIITEENGSIGGEINIDDVIYFSHSKITPQFIHSSVISEEKLKTSAKIFQKSLTLKQDLIATLSSLYKKPQSSRFSIKKNKQFIPFLFLNGIKQDQVFSLSHHGNFSAFILPLTNS